jgi:hypothetical protein
MVETGWFQALWVDWIQLVRGPHRSKPELPTMAQEPHVPLRSGDRLTSFARSALELAITAASSAMGPASNSSL